VTIEKEKSNLEGAHMTCFRRMGMVAAGICFLSAGGCNGRFEVGVPRHAHEQVQKENVYLQEVNEALKAEIDTLSAEKGRLEIILAKSEADREALQEKLAVEIANQRKMWERVEKMGSGITIGPAGELRLPNEVLFRSGSADLRKEAERVLAAVAAEIKSSGGHFRVDGHTDQQPIQKVKNRYSTNWDLSAARAMAVLKYLESQGIPGKQLHLAAYSYHRPADPQDSPQKGNPKNRRVEIVKIQ
jgi:chemotaxis protein MotB